MYGFAGVSPTEDKRRLMALLYYKNVHFGSVDAQAFEKFDAERKFCFSVLLGASRSRNDKSLSNTWTPVSPQEYESAERAYEQFFSSFNRESAATPTLSYVLSSGERPVDFSNLDRWYERDQGERIGRYVL